MNPPTPDPERFVVGVDGSPQSIDALRWAARVAAGAGARIDAITTWTPRVGLAGPYLATAAGTYVTPRQDAQTALERAVTAAYGSDRPPHLTLRVREGSAGHVLVDESLTAQLLVIGSRGMGEVVGLVLGSVSAHCAEKAHCPVLVIHEPEPS